MILTTDVSPLEFLRFLGSTILAFAWPAKVTIEPFVLGGIPCALAFPSAVALRKASRAPLDVFHALIC